MVQKRKVKVTHRFKKVVEILDNTQSVSNKELVKKSKKKSV